MTQTTPYQRLASDARLGLYNGAETVAVFTDPASELRALLSGCGVFDLGWRAKIMVNGEDRVRWLNGMVTNNVKDLPLHHGNYNFLLSPQGRILADMYIYNQGESLLLDTDRSQIETVMKTLDHFIIMDDVQLKQSGLTAVGLCGPESEKILVAAGLDVSGLEHREIRDLQNGASVVRGPEQRPCWYEIWSESGHAEFWDRLVSSGAQPVGSEALEQWRILQGIPRYGQDIREKDLAQETEQNQALNFTKGCYIGQEIVERIRSRGQVHRKFTGFEFQDALPPTGKFEQDGRVMGEITTVAEIGGKKLGMGYVRRETGLPGAKLTVNGVAATVRTLPFKNQ